MIRKDNSQADPDDRTRALGGQGTQTVAVSATGEERHRARGPQIGQSDHPQMPRRGPGYRNDPGTAHRA